MVHAVVESRYDAGWITDTQGRRNRQQSDSIG